ncbi:MAG TPA: heavy metal translocating P-type ATPase metal-binding domain-containing protein [Bacteroidia bacterium]|nr:heavy metal translocating P-type ATPase metal-binding domain-containing protein [Bacteroidia bacterium]
MLDRQIALDCYHCGEMCNDDSLRFENRIFCCQGCKLVYEILTENNLHSYYNLNRSPGNSLKEVKAGNRFGFLDEQSVRSSMLQYSDGNTAVVTFYIPQMHCSSCIWLLENLSTLIPAVIRSQVNFIKRTASITYNEKKLQLSELVAVLSKIGYEPHLDMTDLDGSRSRKVDRSGVYRIGLAGFVFGNIMLFSFPEYFSISDSLDHGFDKVFNYINLILSIPVIFYCSAPFFKSAWQGISNKILNIDVPIALGIAVMFIRSLVEIISSTGSGYLDTMAGLVFFMLVGRAFQDKTYKTISFDRNYKSFFPISVMCKKKGSVEEVSIPVSSIEPDDHLIIRNDELIPADSILYKGTAKLDYSFVTGESDLQLKERGDLIYAGGRHKGESIELKVVKKVSQSYLTQLWNQDAFADIKSEQSFQNLVNRISHYFTIGIVLLAISGWVFWLFQGDTLRAWNAFTAVLIIACPCALALSSPFTLGNIIRIFGRHKFYLKNVTVVEKLANVDTVVFDKTGTLTRRDSNSIAFVGEKLSDHESKLIYSLVKHSSHPLSRVIYSFLKSDIDIKVEHFKEVAGMGLQGYINNTLVRIGSAEFIGSVTRTGGFNKTKVFVSFDNSPRGYFEFGNSYRRDLDKLIDSLKKMGLKLEVLSGDNNGEQAFLKTLFGEKAVFRFNQSPIDKLGIISKLQADKRSVLMVGDGLNDAGALKKSDIGISVSDDINNFSPASDAILSAESFSKLAKFIGLARISRRIIITSFIISLLYNIIGLSYALQGTLSPLIAAILMPLSSVSIIVFTSGISNLIAGNRMKS